MEQDPGPRGSPQVPQGPLSIRESVFGPVLTAKTDSCFSSPCPWQAGQDGCWPCRVRNSNRWPQSRHAYSNKGIKIE